MAANSDARRPSPSLSPGDWAVVVSAVVVVVWRVSADRLARSKMLSQSPSPSLSLSSMLLWLLLSPLSSSLLMLWWLWLSSSLWWLWLSS